MPLLWIQGQLSCALIGNTKLKGVELEGLDYAVMEANELPQSYMNLLKLGVLVLNNLSRDYSWPFVPFRDSLSMVLTLRMPLLML